MNALTTTPRTQETRMGRLSDAEIDDLIHQLSSTKWKELGRRLKAASRADRRAGTNRVNDGLSGGGGGPGPKNQIGDRTGNAASFNADRGPGKDQVRENVEYATAFLQDAAHAAKACANRLDLNDSFGDDAAEPEGCESCARAGIRWPMAGSLMIGDRLWRLCIVCSQTAVKTGEVPTVENIQRRHQGKSAVERVLHGVKAKAKGGRK